MSDATFIDNCFFNSGRRQAFSALEKTLKELKGKDNISEIHFRDTWLKKLSQSPDIVADGWYSPPPFGMSVLFGGDELPCRISFETLRNEASWPSNRVINWKYDLLYVYCSPVHIPSGKIGDIAVTLYFGNDNKILNHFRNTYRATRKILESIVNCNNSLDVFEKSQNIFEKMNLQNCVVSRTDTVPLDLGHTVTSLSAQPTIDKVLSSKHKALLSKSRKFLNGTSNWSFEDGIEFTIEPQLKSGVDSKLPQITYHYLIRKNEGNFIICADIDMLLRQLDLI